MHEHMLDFRGDARLARLTDDPADRLFLARGKNSRGVLQYSAARLRRKRRPFALRAFRRAIGAIDVIGVCGAHRENRLARIRVLVLEHGFAAAVAPRAGDELLVEIAVRLRSLGTVALRRRRGESR